MISLSCCSPLDLYASLRSNRGLLANLVHREIIGRYQGSMLGVLWSFLTPLLMLLVYTFFFSVVFKARWPSTTGDSKAELAIVLFAGLLIFNVFAECINRAPSLILSNVNYVKKILFPLEMLPLVTLGSAIFHFAIGFVVWLVFYAFFIGVPPATAFYLPLILLPFFLLVLGLSWLLASLGVYLRDVGQVTGSLVMVLMFLSPLFYPITALPENYRSLLRMNPLTFAIEQTRGVMIWGEALDWQGWLWQSLLSVVIAWLGYAWFQKTRKGFADVL